MASIFQIDISRNTKCALKDDFRKSSHIGCSLCMKTHKPFSDICGFSYVCMYLRIS